MTIKITTPNGGSDSLDFGCAQTPVVATVTGTEVSSGEGKLELKTTTGGTSATKATVLANGNVGINVAAPTYKLDVNTGTAALGGVAVDLFRSGSLSSSTGGVLNLRPANGAAISNIHNLSIAAYDHSGDTNADGLSINAYDGVSFSTGSNSRQERMRITSAGNVGIGVTNPDLKMEIVDTSSGASKDALLLTNYGAASNTETGIFFSPTEADGAIRGARISALNDGANDSNSVALKFSTGLGAPPVERMRITSAGNVGIGTTTPTNGKLEVTHSSATVPAGHFRNTSGSGDSPALIVQGGANNTGGNFQVKDYAGNVDFQVGGDGAVTLGTPLPVASGGTGATSGVQIVRQHYIPSTGGIVTAAGNSTWQSISTSATISVTANNILTIWWVAGVYARSSMHWAGTVFLNGTNVQSGNWGNGINEGAGTVTGWHTTTGIARKVIPATGNHVLELKLKANAGNIDINRDGNLGYDGAYMIVQETTP